ncbi:DUF998 domain-containing protein [Streptococcus tangpeifui]|uniref:DUF998 domain-containing protein n=1 Tax=Streptococcus tangpeifui TaxID=2709400 RepID=UPI0013EACA22|nr:MULTISPECIES: DUF998 domain-containing protein [unclassified Streptococcus]
MLTDIFAVLAIICILVYYYLLTVLHIKNRGVYHPISQAVSDYGIGDHKNYFQLAGLLSALRNISLALALGFWTYQFDFKEKAIVLLCLALLGTLGVAVFPTDIEGQERTFEGRLHLLFAIFQFTALALVLLNFEDAFLPLKHNFYQLANCLKVLVELGLYGLVAALILPFLKKYFGLFERIFLFFGNLYFLLICFAILSVN